MVISKLFKVTRLGSFQDFGKHPQFLHVEELREWTIVATALGSASSQWMTLASVPQTGISLRLFIEQRKKGTSCQNFMAKQQTVQETQNMVDMLTHAARSYREGRSPRWRQSDQKKGKKRKESRHRRGKRHSGAKKEMGGQETGERCVHTILKGDRQTERLPAGRREIWRRWKKTWYIKRAKAENLHGPGTSRGEKSMHPEPLYKYHLRREADDGKRMESEWWKEEREK